MNIFHNIRFWVSLIVAFNFYFALGAVNGFRKANKQEELLHAMKLWGIFLLKLNKIKVEIDGLEHLNPKKKYIFAANHQSVIDILILSAAMPVPFVFMVKKPLFKVPVFGRYMKNAGFIGMNRNKPRQDYETIKEKTNKNPTNILIFPEGTRSQNGELIKFKSGVHKLAELTQFETLPITINDTRFIMKKGFLSFHPGKTKITIHPSIKFIEDKTEYLETIKKSIESNLIL